MRRRPRGQMRCGTLAMLSSRTVPLKRSRVPAKVAGRRGRIIGTDPQSAKPGNDRDRDVLRSRARRLARRANPYSRWFEGKEFDTDYVDARAVSWALLLGPIKADVIDVLEIGSDEGRSAIFWLEYFPSATLTCVDFFRDPVRSARFDRNTAEYGARLRKLAAASATALGLLVNEGASFDMIYVDGSHRRDDVMVDCLLAYQLLRPGGVMLMDDYDWQPQGPAAEQVAPAIDTFLAWHPEVELLLRSAEVAIRKPGA